MASTKEESVDDSEASYEKTWQGTSKGVSRERNFTSQKVIFVDNLPSSMDKNGFIDLFRHYGSIVDFKFLKHKTGAETGYGFVEFRYWEDGRKAIHKMNWKLIGQRHIRVTCAKPSTKRLSMTNLYVENIPKSWNDETIAGYFSKICKITHARVLVNRKNGQSRGVGFVHCSSNDDANTAIHHVNVENRGREGDLNLFVKFAKVSKAERRMQHPGGGNHGNQEWQNMVSRHYQAQNSFHNHFRLGIADDCKTVTQSYRDRCDYNQRQHRSVSRNSKLNRNTNMRKKYEKRQSKFSNNNDGVQCGNRKTMVDVKESYHQKHNLFMPSQVPIQSCSQVLTQVPIRDVIEPALQQTYCRDQEMMNTGVSPKINHVSPVLQIQFSPGCISPMLSNQTVDPYQWSPLVTPVGRTPVSVASPVPIYGHQIGSPMGIPTYFQGSINQIISPRSPRILACSKFQSQNSRAQPNTICWPSPLSVNQTFSLASPFNIQQQILNLSLLNGGSPPHINRGLQEKACHSVAVHPSKNKTLDYTPAETKGKLIAAAASKESSENYSRDRQDAREEKQQSPDICKVASPAGQLRQMTQNSWPGLQSSLITQPNFSRSGYESRFNRINSYPYIS